MNACHLEQSFEACSLSISAQNKDKEERRRRIRRHAAPLSLPHLITYATNEMDGTDGERRGG